MVDGRWDDATPSFLVLGKNWVTWVTQVEETSMNIEVGRKNRR
jgi:hypothetical protein